MLPQIIGTKLMRCSKISCVWYFHQLLVGKRGGMRELHHANALGYTHASA